MAQDDFITIVSGLPRSGTSMMMRMLEVGGMPVVTDGARRADEDNPRGYYEFEPAKRTRQDASWLPAARGRAVKMVYRLLYDLPPHYEYRVLFMQRDLDEVLRSQRAMLERSGKSSRPVDDRTMSELFERELDQCRRWIRARPCFSVCEVDYNGLVADPRQCLEEVDRFLGGGLDIEAMAAVVEPSLYRNRRTNHVGRPFQAVATAWKGRPTRGNTG